MREDIESSIFTPTLPFTIRVGGEGFFLSQRALHPSPPHPLSNFQQVKGGVTGLGILKVESSLPLHPSRTPLIGNLGLLFWLKNGTIKFTQTNCGEKILGKSAAELNEDERGNISSVTSVLLQLGKRSEQGKVSVNLVRGKVYPWLGSLNLQFKASSKLGSLTSPKVNNHFLDREKEIFWNNFGCSNKYCLFRWRFYTCASCMHWWDDCLQIEIPQKILRFLLNTLTILSVQTHKSTAVLLCFWELFS